MSVKAIKLFDKYIGGPMCFLFGLFSSTSMQIKNHYSRILIIQLWGIGETILTLPAIRALREKYKNANITVLATQRNAAVYENNKDVDKIIVLRMNVFSIKMFMLAHLKSYDLVVDFEEYLNISALISLFAGKERLGFGQSFRGTTYTKTRNYNDKQHTSQTFLDLVRVLGCDLKFNKLIKLKTTGKEQKPIKEFFEKHNIAGKKLVIGIAPGAAESARSRMWPLHKYAKLIDKLIEKYKRKKPAVLLIGADFDNEVNKKVMSMIKHKKRVINCAGRFSLRETFYMIEKCKVFIGNDSGPMHIAAAQGVKTIGLFGPNTPVRWAPLGKGNISLYHKQFCSPCIHTHRGRVPECIFGKDNKCMKAISTDEVVKGVERLIKKQ